MPGMKRIVQVSILTAIVALLAVACSNPRTTPVLTVGDDYSLPLAKYKSLAVTRFGSPEVAETEPIKNHEAYLDEILVRQLKVIDGKHKGFDSDPAVQEDYEEGLKKAAITKLYNDEILSKIIPESAIRDFYKKDTEEIHASHILITIDENKDSTRAKALIDSIYQEAVSGGDFAELAQKYNEDRTTQNGDIGWFRQGLMVLPFEKAAFSLKGGEVSEPVLTRFGWHIIKLHERRPVEDRAPYEEDKDRITQLMARQRSQSLVDGAAEFVENLKEERQVQIDTLQLKQLVEQLKGRLSSPDVVAMLPEDQANLTVVTMDGGSVKLSMNNMRENINRGFGRTRKVENTDQFLDIINGFIAEKYLLPDAAKKTGAYEEEDVIQAAKEAAERRIYQIVQQNLVSNRVEPTDDQIREYFEANPEKYMIDAQYTLVECLVDNKKLATEIFQRASKGENLRDLAVQYTKRITAKNKNGVFGPIRRTQYGAIGRMAAESEIGSLVGPVRIGNDWSVFKVISKEEPRLNEFETVKQRVKTDLRMEMRKSLENTWLDSLRENIDYSINMNVIKRAYPNAKADS